MKFSFNNRGVLLLSCCFMLSAASGPKAGVSRERVVKTLYVDKSENNLVIIKNDPTLYLATEKKEDSLFLRLIPADQAQARVEKRFRDLNVILRVASSMTVGGGSHVHESGEDEAPLAGMTVLTLDMNSAVTDSLGNKAVKVTSAPSSSSYASLGAQAQTELASLRKNYPGIGGQIRRQGR